MAYELSDLDYRLTDIKIAAAPQWYIWYTRPRAEKKVLERLSYRGVEVYLPLRRELRLWSDRKKWVDAPLFNGYIFVRTTQSEFDKVSYTEGILTYVRFDGRPAILREEELEEIKLLLTDPDGLEIEDIKFNAGEKIEVVGGPLRGLTGEIVSHRGNKKLAVYLEQLGKAILVQLPRAYVKRQLRA